MDKNEIEFITDVMPSERTIYWDFPRRFELLLLKRLMKKGDLEISKLKRSDFRPLVHKPFAKALIRASHGRPLNEFDLMAVWPCEAEPFRLSLGTWPDLERKPSFRFDQITRYGWSLVLQINLPASHKRKLKELVEDWELQISYYHPVAEEGELTIAWVRLDFDLETGEALIEEIQSDWVRDVAFNARIYGDDDDQEKWEQYGKLLEPIAKRWSEIAMSAGLWFLLEEIGMSTVFMHTHRSGEKLKNINSGATPKSLYSSVPRKFCFKRTHNGPVFIRDSAKRKKRKIFMDPETEWWILDFEEWDRS